MKVIALKGEERTGLGKANSKKVRNEGKVPCVIYGKEENNHFTVYQADFKPLVYTPDTYLVKVFCWRYGQTSKSARSTISSRIRRYYTC